MRSALLSVFVVGTVISSTYGWGYIFSRFRPEANNYGGYGGAGLGTPAERLTPREQLMEALLGEELLEEEVCNGRRCTSNDHCCPGHICIDFDSTSGGSCMPVDAQRENLECSSDLDCSEGHACEGGQCAMASERKGYSEPCLVSSECDLGRGLCCQLIRRHRQAPRKMCTYFKEPLGCIGHAESEVKRTRISQVGNNSERM